MCVSCVAMQSDTRRSGFECLCGRAQAREVWHGAVGSRSSRLRARIGQAQLEVYFLCVLCQLRGKCTGARAGDSRAADLFGVWAILLRPLLRGGEWTRQPL